MKKISLFLIVGTCLGFLIYDFWLQQEPIAVKVISSAPFVDKMPAEEKRSQSPWEDTNDASVPAEIMAPMPPVIAGELSMVNTETLQTVAGIIDQVERDLDRGNFGKPSDLSFSIVYLFHQSLAAYLRFLRDPDNGPDFHILFHRPFSGRYQFNEDVIVMGNPTLGNGEGRFITTMFHEYQHHLFHTIYGTPEFTNIVWKFYNELAAHIFEELFAAYLPNQFFERAHRGGLPRIIKRQLENGDGYDAIALIYDLMVPPQSDREPFYRFMMPAKDGYLDKRELVHAIDSSFQPDPILVDAYTTIATDYWQRAARN